MKKKSTKEPTQDLLSKDTVISIIKEEIDPFFNEETNLNFKEAWEVLYYISYYIYYIKYILYHILYISYSYYSYIITIFNVISIIKKEIDPFFNEETNLNFIEAHIIYYILYILIILVLLLSLILLLL
jgi:hypothetical protein